jgi:DNA-binding NarL/FixJ family response regulator
MIKTLIVDDSGVFRQSLRRMLLSRYKYMRVGEASTLHDAVLQAHALRADLIFVDVRLPDGNGLDLPRFIAPTLPESRVCIVTSYDLPEYRSAAKEAGACQFLAKSNSTTAQVMSVVQAALSHRAPMLLIDNDDARRAEVAKMLSTHWPVLVVFEARDAKTALDMTAVTKPGLVLLRTASTRRRASCRRSRRSIRMRAWSRSARLPAPRSSPPC